MKDLKARSWVCKAAAFLAHQVEGEGSWLRPADGPASDVVSVAFLAGHAPEIRILTGGGRLLLRSPLRAARLAFVALGGGTQQHLLAISLSGLASGQPCGAAFALGFSTARAAAEMASLLRAVQHGVEAAPGALPAAAAAAAAAAAVPTAAALLLHAMTGDPEAMGRQWWGDEFARCIRDVELAWPSSAAAPAGTNNHSL